MADGVEELLSALQQKNSQLAARSDTMQGIVKDQQTAAEDLLVQQKTAGDDNIIVQQAQDLADQKAQSDTLKAATDLGTNPDASSYLVGSLSSEWQAATKDAIQKRQVLQQAMDTKFLDDPVGWVKAQFQMEGLAADADAASKRRMDVEDSLRFAQTQTQGLPLQLNALKQTASDAVLQAKTASAQAQLSAALDTQKINNASINMKGIQELNQMDATQINNLSTGVSVRMQAEQLGIARQNLANSTASLGLAMQERIDRMKDKETSRQENEMLADTVRKGASVMGFSNVTAFPTQKIMQFLQLKDARTVDFLNAGMQTALADTPVISDNAGTTARVLAQHSAPLKPEQAPLKTFFTNIWAHATSQEGGIEGKYDNTKLDQVTRGAQIFAVKQAAAQMGDIKTGDATNIYSPPPLKSVFALPAIQGSALYKNVFSVQNTAGGLNEFNPEQLVTLTTQAIKDGKITYNEGAAGLQAMFGAARSINNVSRNYVGMGLSPQTGYRTRMTNGIGVNRLYDMSTEQDVNNLLNSRLSSFNSSAKSVLDSRSLLFN